MIKSFSFAKSNIDPRIINAQKAVMDCFKQEVEHTIVIDDNLEHWQFCDQVASKLLDKDGLDSVLILDIDCIPIHRNSFLWFYDKWFAGNIQRSNHLNNNKHVFVAPSCMFLRKSCYKGDSFKPTHRSDVGEELTYEIEDGSGIRAEYLVPTRFLKEPLDGKEQWELNDCLKPFGRFTFFGDINTGKELFMHAFQMRSGQDVELFLHIANEALTKLKNKA